MGMEMYADNIIVYKKLRENRLDGLMFHDDELGNKVSRLK